MKKIILLIPLLLASCQHKSPSPEILPQSSGILQGRTVRDFESLQNSDFNSNNQFQVMVGTTILNQYEYTISSNIFTFGKVVTIGTGGTLSYQSPAIPVAPTGSEFTIQWTN